MAWNKKNYYYQNQIKVLSGTDAEPGYKENDEDNLSEAELKNRVDGVNGDDTKPGNGLYKLVSLIKTKFRQLRDSNWSLIDLNIKSYPDGSKLSDTDNLNSLNGENTFNKHDGSADTIGNFYHASTGRSSDFNKEDLNYPKTIDSENYSQVLKVSAPGGAGGRSTAQGDKKFYARQELLQNMNVNRYMRLHSGSGTSYSHLPIDPETKWTDWYVFVPMTEQEALDLGLIDQQGGPQGWGKVFLKRKNDWTVGSIGFGKDPSMEGVDYSKKSAASAAGANWVQAKIVLGEYTYGKELPSTHYAKNDFKDLSIPKGQIYLQYDETGVEE